MKGHFSPGVPICMAVLDLKHPVLLLSTVQVLPDKRASPSGDTLCSDAVQRVL